jgi:hypothetical protein
MESKLPNDVQADDKPAGALTADDRLRFRMVKESEANPKSEEPSDDRMNEIIQSFCTLAVPGKLCIGCGAASPALFNINVLLGISGRVCRACSERELNDIICTLRSFARCRGCGKPPGTLIVAFGAEAFYACGAACGKLIHNSYKQEVKVFGKKVVHKCFRCGGSAALKCSRCKLAWYCGSACQAADWKAHKVSCADTLRSCSGMGAPAPVDGAVNAEIENHQLRSRRRDVTLETRNLLQKCANNMPIKRRGRVFTACMAHHGRADAPTACILCKMETPHALFMLHTSLGAPPARICVGCGCAKNIIRIFGTLGPLSRCCACRRKGCSAHVHVEDSIHMVCSKDCGATLSAELGQ